MAFPKPVGAISIGSVRLEAEERYIDDSVVLGTTKLAKMYYANIERLDANGRQVDVVRFNIEPHLTAAQITGLSNLLTTIRTRAIAELL